MPEDPKELSAEELEARRRQLDEGDVEGVGAISSEMDRAIESRMSLTETIPANAEFLGFELPYRVR